MSTTQQKEKPTIPESKVDELADLLTTENMEKDDSLSMSDAEQQAYNDIEAQYQIVPDTPVAQNMPPDMQRRFHDSYAGEHPGPAPQPTKLEMDYMHRAAQNDHAENAMAALRKDPDKLVDYLLYTRRTPPLTDTSALYLFHKNPDALLMATDADFKRMGYAVVDKENGWLVEAVEKKETFRRPDGERVYLSEATPEEYEQVVTGEITTSPKDVYTAVMLYDITQTDCPKADHGRVLAANVGAEFTVEEMCGVVKRNGITVNMVEDPYLGFGHYSAKADSITLNTNLTEPEQLQYLIRSYATALQVKTSTAPLEVKVFETEALYRTACTTAGLHAEGMPMSIFLEKAAREPGFDFERSVSRLAKQSAYVHSAIKEEISGPQRSQAMGRVQQQPMPQPSVQANFMKDL